MLSNNELRSANQWFVLYTKKSLIDSSWSQNSFSLPIQSCGARFSNQGHLLWFCNTPFTSHSSPVEETGDLKLRKSIVFISYHHETDWSTIPKCLYRCSYCWSGLQVTQCLKQVSKLCEEQGRDDLQLLWRMAQLGSKVRNSVVWQLFQDAIVLQDT
ncbi:hypothetical protein Gasu2_07290 [Galdieria sulphuraria]|nr:hypothetical protein Gasu2_07290 [Galdieria sulphuraria]